MARATRAVTLPHGVIMDGRVHRTASLRAPTGGDEEQLLDDRLTAPERANRLLERCVLRVGGRRSSRDLVRELVCGDREALLLALRATAFGDRLPCVLSCPACGEALDLDLSIDELLVMPYPDSGTQQEVVLANGRRIRFRLPNGGDLEAAARAGDVDDGVGALLARCIDEAGSVGPEPAGLEPDERSELAAHMAKLDPQAEVSLALRCAACDAEFVAVLDAASLLLDELAGRRDELYEEVHAIALSYHWSEAEILALEVPRRRRYLELLADSAPARVGAWA